LSALHPTGKGTSTSTSTGFRAEYDTGSALPCRWLLLAAGPLGVRTFCLTSADLADPAAVAGALARPGVAASAAVAGTRAKAAG